MLMGFINTPTIEVAQEMGRVFEKCLKYSYENSNVTSIKFKLIYTLEIKNGLQARK